MLMARIVATTLDFSGRHGLAEIDQHALRNCEVT